MNKKIFAVGAGLLAAIALVAALKIRRDTHPRIEFDRVELRSVSLAIPRGWPKPQEEGPNVIIGADVQSLSMSLHDEGKATVAEVVGRMTKGYDETPRVDSETLTNGLLVKTWLVSEPMGEVSQPHRGYVFQAANGKVYSAWQPMARDGRERMRYDNIFRDILASAAFR